MVSKRIPSKLQKHVVNHLGNLFQHRRAFDEKAALSRLPPNLMYDMLQHMYQDSVWQVCLPCATHRQRSASAARRTLDRCVARTLADAIPPQRLVCGAGTLHCSGRW